MLSLQIDVVIQDPLKQTAPTLPGLDANYPSCEAVLPLFDLSSPPSWSGVYPPDDIESSCAYTRVMK